jgi:hypothetical protein
MDSSKIANLCLSGAGMESTPLRAFFLTDTSNIGLNIENSPALVKWRFRFFYLSPKKPFRQGVFMQIVTATQMNKLAEQAATPTAQCAQRLDKLFEKGFEGLRINLSKTLKDLEDWDAWCSVVDNAGIPRMELFDLSEQEYQSILEMARTRFNHELFQVSEKIEDKTCYHIEIAIRKTEAPVAHFIEKVNSENLDALYSETRPSLQTAFDYELHKYMSAIQEAAKGGEHTVTDLYIDTDNPYIEEIRQLLIKLGFKARVRHINHDFYEPSLTIEW